MSELFKKYDIPAPRYTSYPTVPYWQNNLDTDTWIGHLNATLEKGDAGWSMYVHVPFCESLCTFCGCNNVITRNHTLEDRYVNTLLAEWRLYLAQVPSLRERPLKQIHLGGGTPTFLSAANLTRLLNEMFKDAKLAPDWEGSIEVDPRKTSVDQLRALHELGFRRLSLGVQDFDPHVQKLVNRNQSFECTRDIVVAAREIGYDSINFDLIYGLPAQNDQTMSYTIEKTLKLRPDRIAFYSFAMVPWIKPQQRLFSEDDLPKANEKRKLYETGRAAFERAGYQEIGMDHFALPTDSLAQAREDGTLHRNFMGYTHSSTDVLLGLGVSSISETPLSFHQNEKVLPKYQELVEQGTIPTLKGHAHSDEDRRRRRQILNLMTEMEVELESEEQAHQAEDFLGEMLRDGLLKLERNRLKVNEEGKPFLRNACMFFDERLKQQQPERKIFSQSI